MKLIRECSFTLRLRIPLHAQRAQTTPVLCLVLSPVLRPVLSPRIASQQSPSHSPSLTHARTHLPPPPQRRSWRSLTRSSPSTDSPHKVRVILRFITANLFVVYGFPARGERIDAGWRTLLPLSPLHSPALPCNRTVQSVDVPCSYTTYPNVPWRTYRSFYPFYPSSHPAGSPRIHRRSYGRRHAGT